MSDIREQKPEPGLPVVIRRRQHISLVWLVPTIATLIGFSLLLHTWLSTGPTISVSFQTATGLEAGKTPVKYKDVSIGTVSSITLSEDGSHVVAAVSLNKSAENVARADTRFWVVRPRIGLGGVSGIDTLLSGAYIGVDKGTSQQSSRVFTGLETPPTVINGMPGKSFMIHADDLGSLDIGSPVYYRRIQVGRVASYRLGADGRGIELQVFVDSPYDRFVTIGTRFWNASGVDVSLGADGLKLNTQSMATVMAGGIAFATPLGSRQDRAPAQTHFELAKDEQTAMAPPDGPGQYIQLRFEQSLRGLAVGAPVEFSGLNIGQVVSISLDYDAAKHRFPSIVGILVYPSRVGNVLEQLPKYGGDSGQQAAQFLASMVQHGLRAQARSGNLLTGQLYISLEFVPNASAVAFDIHARPLTLPTVSGSFDHMQEQIASIVAKIEKMPLDSIGERVDASLADLHETLRQVNGQILPAATQTLQQTNQALGAVQSTFAADAPLQQNLQQSLQEVQRTAGSLRTLIDLLSRHPEALLRGMSSDSHPTSNANPAATGN
ncbi:intermembrane transport protein PqiB [Paraburkholderia lacunae]|uniref:Mammalian cell entry protein n=1 Tax=Paraburkholderia lacunae TaxID=2211104 RepID=A0A370MYK2_9BURK|nr:MlaD family protein [Paraburkholderia lacunae]RDJ98434.1 mammalian cell entry protein [Paraburkholderia lacunae]